MAGPENDKDGISRIFVEIESENNLEEDKAKKKKTIKSFFSY